MGINLAREKLFQEIECNQQDKVREILVKYPQLVNEFFDKEQQALPITRAAWLGHVKTLEVLIVFSADINKQVSNGYCALFYACERGQTQVLKKLLSCKQLKIEVVDNRGYTALDIAIIFGYYNCALLLFQRGLKIKHQDFYELQIDNFVDYQIDFEWFIRNLKEQNPFTDINANKFLFKKKQKKNKKVIIDPNESWKEFFRSMLGFEEPRVIPLNKMPKDFDPEERSLHKVKSLINWRNQNYIENYDRNEDKENEMQEVIDIENKVQEKKIKSVVINQFTINTIKLQKIKINKPNIKFEYTYVKTNKKQLKFYLSKFQQNIFLGGLNQFNIRTYDLRH